MTYLIAATMSLYRGDIYGSSWKNIELYRGIAGKSHSFDVYSNLKHAKIKTVMRLLPLFDNMHEFLLKFRVA